jgi:sulfhydrogenase subunit beta (sulfur reductase)
LKTITIERSELDRLIEVLKRRGFTVIGPRVDGAAIVYDELASAGELPTGWTDEQTNGSYRLKRRSDAAVFGWTVGPQSWKKFLFPPIQKLFTTQKAAKGLDLSKSKTQAEQKEEAVKYAFVGVRSCELSAIAIQDKIFTGGPFIDPLYARKRSNAFIVAVNCAQAGGTCFCTSMNSGPKAAEGFDLALTEIVDPARHRFVVEVATEQGTEIVKSLKQEPASPEDIELARTILHTAAQQMGKSLDTTNVKNILYENAEHPRWEQTAARCLSCANCTMVCPTCFCSTVEDVTDLAGNSAGRERKWDSCFTLDFSYIHGGSVRTSTKARYRQWLTHKLASWIDQFGSFGCVGCGRCITWCPVGIDITEEVRAIRESKS